MPDPFISWLTLLRTTAATIQAPLISPSSPLPSDITPSSSHPASTRPFSSVPTCLQLHPLPFSIQTATPSQQVTPISHPTNASLESHQTSLALHPGSSTHSFSTSLPSILPPLLGPLFLLPILPQDPKSSYCYHPSYFLFSFFL